jgi:RNA polymerase sigma-70 factor, ECF subfamily
MEQATECIDHMAEREAYSVRAAAETLVRDQTLVDMVRIEVPGLRAYARLMNNDIVVADQLVADTLNRAFASDSLPRRASCLRLPLFAILRTVLASDQHRPHQDTADISGLEGVLILLNFEDREAIILTVAAQFTESETGKICACPPATVKRRMHRGLARIAQLMPPLKVQ